MNVIFNYSTWEKEEDIITKFFEYRGIRIRKIHLNIYRLYLFLMALPFLVGVGFFCYFKIYPIVKPMIESSQFEYNQLIVPAVELVGLLIVIFGSLAFIRRTSKIRGKYFVRVLHRQMLAQMILSRNWTDRKVKKSTNGKTRESVKFPKVYYRHKKFTTEITVPTDGKRYHEQMLKIGPILEQMYFADLIESTSELGFTKYELLIGLTVEAMKKVNAEKVVSTFGAGMIQIPSIHMNLPILEGMSQENLSVGAGTMKPNQELGKGNFTLAGHYMTNAGLLFGGIKNVKKNDLVQVTYENKTMNFKVTKVKQITAEDNQVIFDSEGNGILTLITCDSSVVGTAGRLMVRCEPV